MSRTMDARFSALRSPDRFRTYTIGQLCREFAITPRAVRFYEAQGLIAPLREHGGRDGGARVFVWRDRVRLSLVVKGRRVGLSIVDIRALLETYDREGEAAQGVLALEVFRKRIAALEAERRQVTEAIDDLRVACGRMEEGPLRPEPVRRPVAVPRHRELALNP